MEKTVNIPSGITIDVDKFDVKVKGPKGSLEKNFYSPLFSKDILIKKADDKMVISSDSDRKKVRAMIGTIHAITSHMIKGVTEGYEVKMKIVYMHFPFTIKITGKEILVNNFLGEKTPRKTKIVGDCKVEIKGDEVIVTGISKDDVGHTASNLEKVSYIKARDRRVFQDGIFWLK
jgi:large subunit ribosomal protein L6